MFLISKMIMLMMISLTISSITILSPFTMGLYVLTMAILMSIMTNIISMAWLSMVMFLVYISGLLVVFAYFLAIQPNYMNEWKKFLGVTSMILLVLTMLTSNMIKINYPENTSMMNLRAKSMEPSYIMMFENSLTLSLMGLILFLVLITVVKTVDLKKGSLRPFLP